jgi:HSP20 family protein
MLTNPKRHPSKQPNTNLTTTASITMALSRRLFGFDDFFDPRFRDPIADIVQMPVLDIERDPFMVLQRSSPGYEVHSTDKEWKLAVDVPGVQAPDMSVNLEDNGRLLHLSGGRKVVKDNQVSESRFDKRFTIGDDIDISQITANLENGVLTVTAPKKEKKEPETVKIPITMGTASAQIEDEKKKE